MQLSDFDYFVPEELVAQRPLEQRDASRMLVLHKSSGKIEHRVFKNLPEFLGPSDLMIFNQSKVVKARLHGLRETGGRVEVFLTKRISPNSFECLVKATAANKAGLSFEIGEGLRGKILGPGSEPMLFIVEFSATGASLESRIEQFGKVPLPPYIQREAELEDISRYQTIYAKNAGSVAAPTAGLHFTPAIIEEIKSKGVELDFVTLHVGLGTFQPIKVENIADHSMHKEEFSLNDGLKEKCEAARGKGRRVIAVGTTSVRALESAARGKQNETNLFLKPGEKFHWVDAMLTNFHQPKSSLVVMLSAFVGKDLLFEAYQKAVEEKYRFFSYGDCMLVVE